VVLGLGTRSYEGAAMEIQGSQICYSSAEMPITNVFEGELSEVL
jgi:hypothetical protein